MGNSKLSDRSVAVLEMIAAGNTYEQILAAYPDLTYLDIFRAAEEALELVVRLPGDDGRKVVTLAERRERYPRHGEPWGEGEDRQLESMVRSGMTVARIAGQLQRNRGAIRSRISKLNLVGELTAKEQERFRRIVESGREGN